MEREFFIDNLLVRIHFIIVMITWARLAPWEFKFPFPGSLISIFSVAAIKHLSSSHSFLVCSYIVILVDSRAFNVFGGGGRYDEITSTTNLGRFVAFLYKKIIAFKSFWQ